MKTILRVIVLSAVVCTAYSLCNSCSATTHVACVANDKFSICVNGLPSTAVTQCPTGTVCTGTSQVCSPAGTTAGACSRCGTCDSNNAFACTGYTTFALCYGTATPSSANFTCPGNLICNIDDPQICVDPTAGIGGTCPSSTATSPTVTTPTTSTPTVTTPTTSSSTVTTPTTSSSTVTTPTTSSSTVTTPTTSSSTVTTSTTTVSPAADPQAYCTNLASSGRYEITTDPYCKQYILCTLYNSTWIGNLYECPGSTLFNSTTKLCGVGTPERCVS